VILREGSSKNDIVIDDYCSIWSILISENRGKIKIGEWVNIRERTKIIACESIEIKKETIISFDVTIVDNNNHPVSPRYRRMLNHTPHYSDERQYKHSESAPIVIGENVWIGQNVRIC
jgi:maltose O-acetyltransferase